MTDQSNKAFDELFCDSLCEPSLYFQSLQMKQELLCVTRFMVSVTLTDCSHDSVKETAQVSHTEHFMKTKASQRSLHFFKKQTM